MNRESKDTFLTIVIGIIQAIISGAVAYFFNGGVILIIAIVVVDLVLFLVLYLYFKNRMSSKEDALNKIIVEKDELINLYKNIGIEGCTKELQGTQFEPRQCMRKVKKYLDFMGVGGNKWVDQDDKLQLFEEMLKRVQAQHGSVRYLLIDPRCDGYKKLKELRQNKVPSSSYKRFKKLVKKYSCLEVRLYDDLPSFRLQFVDQEYVAVSRYFIEHELHTQKQFGWKIPHLIVRAEKIGNIEDGETDYPITLYKSFEQLYQYIWDRSVDIKTIELPVQE